jgi:hypothetical protein
LIVAYLSRGEKEGAAPTLIHRHFISARIFLDLLRALFIHKLFLMADTIVNTPGNNDSSSAGGGVVVALIIVVALIVGAIILYQNGVFGAAAPTPQGTNINVTVPTPNPITPAPANP